MKIISSSLIKSLKIEPSQCVQWVRDSFLMKKTVQLPPKISLHPQGNDFFNTMPCLISQLQLFSVKVVHRTRNSVPALGSDIWLYNSTTGDLLAMLDGDWITTMRTGAVAALAAQTFRRSGEVKYGFMGLGNTGRAALLCLLDSEPEVHHQVVLLRYKNQAELFIDRFTGYNNVTFTIVDTALELISESDVLISCITDASGLVCEKDEMFKQGCLVIPVHTRGFQNCDLFFDRVFADDRGHVQGFKYFDRFRSFAEFSDVLDNTIQGRTNDSEQILCYNIGIGLHDALFSWKILQLLKESSDEVNLVRETSKFWI